MKKEVKSEMDEAMVNAVWNIIEIDPVMSYTIENAKGSAICICSGPYSTRGKYTLYFGRGIIAEGFKTLKKADERAKEILSKSEKPVLITIKRYGKLYERWRSK